MGKFLFTIAPVASCRYGDMDPNIDGSAMDSPNLVNLVHRARGILASNPHMPLSELKNVLAIGKQEEAPAPAQPAAPPPQPQASPQVPMPQVASSQEPHSLSSSLAGLSIHRQDGRSVQLPAEISSPHVPRWESRPVAVLPAPTATTAPAAFHSGSSRPEMHAPPTVHQPAAVYQPAVHQPAAHQPAVQSSGGNGGESQQLAWAAERIHELEMQLAAEQQSSA